MKMAVKAVICVVALSLVSPAIAKGGKGGGKGGFKSSSYTIKPSTSKSTTTTKEETERPKVGYRFGGSGVASNSNNHPCRQHGGFSHCEVSTGKYVCKDSSVVVGNKVCR